MDIYSPKPSTRVGGHGLASEGHAVYHHEGGSIRRTYQSEGQALCQCGEWSPELPSTAARKRWHADHKAMVVKRMRAAGNYRY